MVGITALKEHFHTMTKDFLNKTFCHCQIWSLFLFARNIRLSSALRQLNMTKTGLIVCHYYYWSKHIYWGILFPEKLYVIVIFGI